MHCFVEVGASDNSLFHIRRMVVVACSRRWFDSVGFNIRLFFEMKDGNGLCTMAILLLIAMVVWSIIAFIDFIISGGWRWLLVIFGVLLLLAFIRTE